jgi:hypothetical protein
MHVTHPPSQYYSIQTVLYCCLSKLMGGVRDVITPPPPGSSTRDRVQPTEFFFGGGG